MKQVEDSLVEYTIIILDWEEIKDTEEVVLELNLLRLLVVLVVAVVTVHALVHVLVPVVVELVVAVKILIIT